MGPKLQNSYNSKWFKIGHAVLNIVFWYDGFFTTNLYKLTKIYFLKILFVAVFLFLIEEKLQYCIGFCHPSTFDYIRIVTIFVVMLPPINKPP